MSAPASGGRVLAAWAVHAYTACGAVIALVALQAAQEHRFTAAFLWLGVALLIDSSDGTLARTVGVKRVLPWFDGTLLDNIVDYLTYVFVPVVLLYEAELLAGSPLAVAAVPLLASAYGFSRTDAKTSDHYFRGFPSYWNVVALYAWLLPLSPAATTLVVLILSGLVFAPVKFVYPSRTPHLRALTVGLCIVWCAVLLAVLVLRPTSTATLVWGSLAFPVYYLALSLWLQASHTRVAG